MCRSQWEPMMPASVMAYSSKELVSQADRMASRSSSVWVSPELAMIAGLIRRRPSSCSAASRPSTDP